MVETTGEADRVKRDRVQIECECGQTTTGESNLHAEINHLLHYRRKHDLSTEERTEVNNQLAKRGYDP